MRRSVATPRVPEEGAGVGVFGERAGDLAGQESDLLDERLERGDEAKHECGLRPCLELAGSAGGCLTQPGEQLWGAAPTGVDVAGEEARQPFLAKRARVGGTRIALDEGTEGLELRLQLVTDRDPTPYRRSGCLTPPGGAGLMQAVYAANDEGAPSGVLSRDVTVRAASVDALADCGRADSQISKSKQTKAGVTNEQ
jgi:hypothetical protein